MVRPVLSCSHVSQLHVFDVLVGYTAVSLFRSLIRQRAVFFQWAVSFLRVANVPLTFFGGVLWTYWVEKRPTQSGKVPMVIFLLSSRMNSDVLLLLWWQQSSQLLGNSTHGGEVMLAISGNVELCDFIYSNYKNFNEKQQPEGKLLWQLSLWVSCFLVSLRSLNAPHGS